MPFLPRVWRLHTDIKPDLGIRARKKERLHASTTTLDERTASLRRGTGTYLTPHHSSGGGMARRRAPLSMSTQRCEALRRSFESFKKGVPHPTETNWKDMLSDSERQLRDAKKMLRQRRSEDNTVAVSNGEADIACMEILLIDIQREFKGWKEKLDPR
jgi:hypothetical protein